MKNIKTIKKEEKVIKTSKITTPKDNEIIIPLLKENDLEVFRGKKVVIYGFNSNTQYLVKVLNMKKIPVIGYFTENQLNRNQKMKVKIKTGLSYVNIERLSRKKDIVVQIESINVRETTSQKDALEKLGFTTTEIPASLLLLSFYGEYQLKYLKKSIIFRTLSSYIYLLSYIYMPKNTPKKWASFKKGNNNSPVIICSPRKTADLALDTTFKINNVEFFNLWHKTRVLNRKKDERSFGTLKVLLGVREPISQNMSLLYQNIGGSAVRNIPYLELFGSKRSKKDVLNKYRSLKTCNACNVQDLWNIYSDFYLEMEKRKKYNFTNGFIQLSINQYKFHLLDPLAYSFDQDKGYTIIKDGNTEVFIYQLEKLNNLVPELSEWVGVPLIKLEKGNVGEEKWVGESYKQAQSHLKITQEYFDKCYDEPYVKHFYSEADIEKFKDRWQSHIMED